MRDSYGTYDGSKPEPPYECPECSDLRAKLQAAEATIEDVVSALGNEVKHEGPRLAAMRVKSERDELRARAEAAEARGYELESIQASVCPEDFGIVEYVDSLKSRAEAAEAEVARLRNDLLAYGHHLESCKMLCLAKTDGWKYAKLHGCSCGFDSAKEK